MRRMGREVRRVRGRGEEKAFLSLQPILLSPRSPNCLHLRAWYTIAGGKRRDCLQSVVKFDMYLIKYNHDTWLNLTRATVKLPSWLTVSNTPVFHWLCSSITSWLNWGISSYRCSGHHPKLKNISIWRNGHPASTSSLPPFPLPRSQEGNAKQGLLAGYYNTNRTYG